MLLDLFYKKTSMVCIDVGYRNIKVVEVTVRKNNNIFIHGIAATPWIVLRTVIYDVSVLVC